MSIKITSQPTSIEGLLFCTYKKFEDDRGYFFESYNSKEFMSVGINNTFVQNNVSFSKKNTLRGLHYQLKNPQSKIVNVIRGEIYDVVVDLRLNSPTFKKVFSINLDEKIDSFLFLPAGLAHGFFVKSEDAMVTYMCDQFYDPQDEFGLYWADKNLNITWPFNTEHEEIHISDKDRNFPSLAEIDENFLPTF